MLYDTHVITLDPDSPRFALFRKANAHLPFQIFRAVPGAGLSQAERLAQNLATPDCLSAGAVTDGEIGAAASHLALWREAKHRNVPMLILEDDAITHPKIAEVVAGLDLSGVDLLFFAVNTDTLLATVSAEGVREFSSFADRYPPPARIADILAGTDLRRLSMRRLLNGFGLCCYLVTPQGAEKLIRDVLPLRRDFVEIQGLSGVRVGGTSIDRRLNALYGDLRAFVMRPFLAWTPNTDSTTRSK